MPAAMAALHGRISEHQSENIFHSSAFVFANPAHHIDEARCAGIGASLAVICKFADCHLGWIALACPCFYALELERRGQGNLSALLFPVSSIAGKIVFSFWQACDVFIG